MDFKLLVKGSRVLKGWEPLNSNKTFGFDFSILDIISQLNISIPKDDLKYASL